MPLSLSLWGARASHDISPSRDRPIQPSHRLTVPSIHIAPLFINQTSNLKRISALTPDPTALHSTDHHPLSTNRPFDHSKRQIINVLLLFYMHLTHRSTPEIDRTDQPASHPGPSPATTRTLSELGSPNVKMKLKLKIITIAHRVRVLLVRDPAL